MFEDPGESFWGNAQLGGNVALALGQFDGQTAHPFIGLRMAQQPFGASRIGVAGLMQAIRAGNVVVANMPGAVARTSTFALNNATLGHGLALANKGWRQALRDDAHLKAGLNVCQGQVTYAAVARALGYEAVAADPMLGH